MNVSTIPQDKSPVDLDFKAFASWGMKATVVKVPAVTPRIMAPSIAYTGHFSSFHAMSQNIHS